MVFATPKARPTVIPHASEGSRWSGDHLTPSNGYSSLFTSGLMRSKTPHTMSPSSPAEVIPFARVVSHPSRTSPPRSPRKRHSPSKPLASPSRRRPSALPSSPGKSRIAAAAADRALTDVMHKLRLYAGTSLSPQKQSRWSLSSEESSDSGRTGGQCRPRPSGESIRSQRSRTTVKSKKSAWSLRSRKSEEGDRPVFGAEEPPPMPELKDAPVQLLPPATPGRGRRVVEGLARRLGLTPKKRKGKELATPSRPQTPAATDPVPDFPPPLPALTDRTPSKKGSMTTLRSLAKKTSTGTLRSVRSIKSVHGQAPDSGSTTDLPPDLPKSLALPLPPVTPRRGPMPKSSIGPPKARPAVSPSAFDSAPRLAPKTPERQEGVDAESRRDAEAMDVDVDEIITFASARTPARITPATATSHGPPATTCAPHTPQAYASNMIPTRESPRQEYGWPLFGPVHDIQSSPRTPAQRVPPADFDTSDFLTSTPVSQRIGPAPDLSFHSARSAKSGSAAAQSTPLTVKAVNAQAQAQAKTPSKPRRLLDLLPTYARLQQAQAQTTLVEIAKENAGVAGGGGGSTTPKSKVRIPWRKKSLPQPSDVSAVLVKQGSILPRLGSDTAVLSARSDNVMSMYDCGPARSETLVRPATSHGHRRENAWTSKEEEMPIPTRRYFQDGANMNNYAAYGSNTPPAKLAVGSGPNQTARHHRRPRVPDFSRPMSKQDLSMSISVSGSVSAAPQASSPFGPSPNNHNPRKPGNPMLAADHADADTPMSADSAQTSYFSTSVRLQGESASKSDPTRLASGESGTGGGGAHGRMDSKDSLMTTESGFTSYTAHTAHTTYTTHSTHTTHTARTTHTATSDSSGVGEWELERYLKDLETDTEEEDGSSLMGLGTSYEESLASYASKMPVAMSDGRREVGNGGVDQGKKAVIQHARYGIRI